MSYNKLHRAIVNQLPAVMLVKITKPTHGGRNQNVADSFAGDTD